MTSEDPGFRSAIALFCARQILGLIFLMAGIWKVFSLGVIEHAQRYFLPFAESSFLPAWALWVAGTVVPFVELLAGALLIIGWKIIVALVALGGVLILVTFGHLLAEPLFQFHTHVIPRLALLLFLLMVPARYDRFSIDHWIQRRKSHSDH